MKQMKRILYMLLAASVLLWGCTAEVEPVTFTAPVVEFPDENESLATVSVGEPATFTAEIVSGNGLTTGWYVDGVLESSGSTLTYTWDAPGEYVVRFEASNGAGSVEKEYNVSVTDRLEIFISSESEYEVGESVDFYEDSFMRLYAVVVEGSNVQHEWKVDGEIKCTEAYFNTYELDLGAATHTVSYRGWNSVGEVEKEFTANVVERPLTVSFSEEATTIAGLVGLTVSITATVDYGATGVEHSWKVDDAEVSTTNEFSHQFDEAGDYEISYYGVNAKGEEVNRTWAVVVSTREEVLLDDFEGGEKGIFVTQNGAKVGIEANPFPSEKNSSAYVLAARGDSGSGYFGFTESVVSAMGINIDDWDGIKVDMYIPSDVFKFYPVMDAKTGSSNYVYANGFDKETGEPYEWDTWVTLEYDIDFAGMKQLQPRAFVNANGGGAGKKGGVVYYDNFYLYKNN